MPITFSRRGGPRKPRPVAPPRVGHFYLNLTDHRLFCLNETARQLLHEGLPVNPAEAQNQSLMHLDGSTVTLHELPLFVAWRERRSSEETYLWPRSGGVPTVLSWNAAPLMGPTREVVGVSATVVIAPHEPDWEELAGMAHDLRTPLQALRLLASIVQTMPGPEVMSDVIQRLKGATERTLNIAQELLSWCKAPILACQHGRREWFPLGPLLLSLLAEQETTARSKGISLESSLECAHNLTVYSNRTRLGRVIGNLLANAVRYTSAGKVSFVTTVRGSSGDNAPALVVAIEDTGSGLSEEEQESIFEPYLRGRAGMADSDSGGSGIGLATVDRLVGELGLSLEVSSQFGQGSRFELVIPGDLIRHRVVA